MCLTCCWVRVSWCHCPQLSMDAGQLILPAPNASLPVLIGEGVQLLGVNFTEAVPFGSRPDLLQAITGTCVCGVGCHINRMFARVSKGEQGPHVTVPNSCTQGCGSVVALLRAPLSCARPRPCEGSINSLHRCCTAPCASLCFNGLLLRLQSDGACCSLTVTQGLTVAAACTQSSSVLSPSLCCLPVQCGRTRLA